MNTWLMNEALTSVRKLREHLHELSEQEVLAALNLELGSRRRKHVILLLQTKAKKLYQASLTKEK